MKTILTSGFFWFVIFIIFVVAFAYVLKRWGEVTAKQAKEYEDYYREVQDDIWHLPMNADNCDLIRDKLKKLGKMSYKNPEKLIVLRHSFNKRFFVPRLQEVIETNLKKKK